MTTSFDNLATEYDLQMGETGDFNHQYSIDPSLFELMDLGKLAQISNLKIYDIGAGNGYLARLFAKKFKNSQVFASDISPKLIQIAQDRSLCSTTESNSEAESLQSDISHKQNVENSKNFSKINYFVADGSDFNYFSKDYNGTFDLIYANMSIHYIENLASFVVGINRLLKTSGKFVLTTSHPLGDLKLFSTKAKNQLSKSQMIEVMSKYLNNYCQETTFGDFPLIIHKRSISFYLNFFIQNGFRLEKMLEIPKVHQPETEISNLDNSTELSVNKLMKNTGIPTYFGLSFVKM